MCVPFFVYKTKNDFFAAEATDTRQNQARASPPLANNGGLISSQIRLQEDAFRSYTHSEREFHYDCAEHPRRQSSAVGTTECLLTFPGLRLDVPLR